MTLKQIMVAVRAVIYARYSSEAQRPSSIVDQVRRCTRYAEEHGMTVVREYADEAEKGWNLERSEFQALLLAAKERQFDVILVDDLSRMFRDMGAQSKVLQQLRILGIRVIAVADGWDSTSPGAKLAAGIKGLMNEHYLDALGQLTFRGQEGRIVAGLSAGGDVYGYKPERVEVLTANGSDSATRKVVDEVQAEVVREIYALFADGHSPASIADRLNARGVEAPRKGLWSRNAIYGDRRDLSGILNNPIYAGELVWGRAEFLRDPDTGKRKKVRKPPTEWVRRPAPELRIVPDELVSAVQARMLATAKKGDAIRKGRANAAARSGADGKYMLTGLLRCATCGGPVSSTARDTFGCSVRHNRGTFACSNDVKFSRILAERAVLEAVQAQLFSQEAIAHFCELVASEYAEKTDAGSGAVERLTRALAAVDKKIAGCTSFIEAGNASTSIAARLRQLEEEADSMRAELGRLRAEKPATEEDLRALQQAAVLALRDLPDLLAGSEAEVRYLLSNLLGEATVTPMSDGTVEIRLTGQVSGLLAVRAKCQRRHGTKEIGPAESAGPMLGNVVARACNVRRKLIRAAS